MSASAAVFDEPKPKPGTVGDLVKAVSRDPVVQAKLDTIGKLVIEKVESEWGHGKLVQDVSAKSRPPPDRGRVDEPR